MTSRLSSAKEHALRFLIHPIRSIPFRAKIVGLVISVTLVLGLVSAVEARRDMYSILSASLDARSRALAREIASEIADDLATRDDYAVSHRLAQSRSFNPEIVYSFVTDAAGEPVASTFSAGVPVDLLGLTPSGETESATPLITAVIIDGQRVRDVAARVYGSPPDAAYLHIGIGEREIDETIGRAIRRILGLTLVAASLAALAGLALSSLLLIPLDNLLRGMRALGSGDLSRRVPATGDSEIAFLSESFNDMAGRLELGQRLLSEHLHQIEISNLELGLFQRIRGAAYGGGTPAEYLRSAVSAVVEDLDAVAGWVCLHEDASVFYCVSAGTPAGLACTDCPEELRFGCMQPDGVDAPAAACPLLASMRQHVGPLESCSSRFAAADISRGEGVTGLIVIVLSSDSDVHEARTILRAVADELLIVLENVRLRDDRIAREARLESLLSQAFSTQENERRRIARELHDDIAQKMTFIKVGLKVLDDALAKGEDTHAIVDSLRENVSEGIDGVRRAVAHLGSAPLDRLGLAPAIERLLREASSTFGFEADLQVVGMRDGLLSPEVELAAYRITQEALSNAGRHSGCSRVSVVVHCRARALEVVVEDDGCGFAAEDRRHDAASGRHVGLDGMKERATLVGGSLRVESRLGVGTSVHVRLPAGVSSGEGV